MDDTATDSLICALLAAGCQHLSQLGLELRDAVTNQVAVEAMTAATPPATQRRCPTWVEWFHHNQCDCDEPLLIRQRVIRRNNVIPDRKIRGRERKGL